MGSMGNVNQNSAFGIASILFCQLYTDVDGGVIWDGIPSVIPAQAGIQSVDSAFPRVCRVDSRLRGNDFAPIDTSIRPTDHRPRTTDYGRCFS